MPALTGLYDDEPLILARLADTDNGGVIPVDMFKTIDSGDAVAGTKADDIPPLCDAVFIQPGSVIDEPRLMRDEFVEGREWWVVVCIEFVAGESAAKTAGPKLMAVIEALNDWRDPSNADHFPKKMKYIRREAPIYQRGYAEFPLLFSNSIKLTKKGDTL